MVYFKLKRPNPHLYYCSHTRPKWKKVRLKMGRIYKLETTSINAELATEIGHIDVLIQLGKRINRVPEIRKKPPQPEEVPNDINKRC